MGFVQLHEQVHFLHAMLLATLNNLFECREAEAAMRSCLVFRVLQNLQQEGYRYLFAPIARIGNGR